MHTYLPTQLLSIACISKVYNPNTGQRVSFIPLRVHHLDGLYVYISRSNKRIAKSFVFTVKERKQYKNKERWVGVFAVAV